MRQAAAPRLCGIDNDTKCGCLILSLLILRMQEPLPQSSILEEAMPYGSQIKSHGFH